MSYLSNWGCLRDFSTGQVGVMHAYIILYMAEGGWPLPGIGGEPWYNKNNLVLSSSVNNDETDQIYAPENIQAPPTNDTYILNSGSNVRLHGQESVTLLPGFHAKQGTDFHATTGLISDCDLMYDGQVTNSNGRTTNRVSNNINYDMIDRVNEMLLNALNNQGKNNFEFTLDEVLTTNKALVFPNPIDGKVHFKLGVENESLSMLEVFDINGNRVIEVEIIDNKSEIDLSHLPSGTYIYRIDTQDELLTGKIIKK